MLTTPILLLAVNSLAAPTAAPDRCTNRLECELRCPEVSVQSQKTVKGREITFCDPVGMQVTWRDNTTKISQGEIYGEQKSGLWRNWWPSGKLKNERRYSDTGLAHGLQVSWYENGTKRSEVRYDEGLRDGDFMRWHPNGNKSAEGSYKQGQLSGTTKEFHSNGRPAAEGVVEDGKVNWQRFYSSGRKGLVGQTLQGQGPGDPEKPIGKWDLWHPNNKQLAEMRFNNRGIDGRYRRWTQGGVLMEQREYRDGEADGEHQRWFLNGTLAERTAYRRGKRHGSYLRNYPSGVLAEEGSYKDGSRDGTWRQFYRDGQLASQWVHNSQGTRLTRYDRFGAKRFEQQLKNGLAHGTAQVFNAAEKRTAEGDYRAGERHGVWRFWGDDGKPSAKGDFDEGRRVGDWRYDYPGGGKRWIVFPVKGKKFGREFSYELQGKNLRGCRKLAEKGQCWSLITLNPKGDVRVHVALPADWREEAVRRCKEDSKQTACQIDHGDVLTAFSVLEKLEAGRRIGSPASCWDDAGEPEKCPKLDEDLLPNPKKAETAPPPESPFDACHDKASCEALCADWSEDNEPLAAEPSRAVKEKWRLACEPSGYEVTFHRNNRIASVGQRNLPHRRAPSAQRTGPWRFYDTEGQLIEEGSFGTGLKQGEWLRYHANGALAAKVRYVNDMEQGPEKSFHPNGKPEASGVYKDGVRIGLWHFYDDKGQPVSRGAFRKGLRHGNWVLFDGHGKPEAKGAYKLGRMVGRWLHFTPKGQRKAVCTWSTKGDVDLRACSDARNKKLHLGTLMDGLPHGDWTYYFPNGKKRRAGTMRDGERHGLWRFWHPSGSKRAKGVYEAGKKVGEWSCWDERGRSVDCS